MHLRDKIEVDVKNPSNYNPSSDFIKFNLSNVQKQKLQKLLRKTLCRSLLFYLFFYFI